MRPGQFLQYVLVGATALIAVAAGVVPGRAEPGPVASATAAFVRGETPTPDVVGAVRAHAAARSAVRTSTDAALAALAPAVRRASDPRALDDAFRSYFAFRAAHPERVAKPYLYFVDYGLPSTEPRGWVFDMETLAVVDGPFTVAHGRGSSTRDGVPTRFSNAPGSAATSLGLYVAQEAYAFLGHAAGRPYRAAGLRLSGVSAGFNDRARERRVVAHGAPYVTPARAGRSEGCPAMEPARAARLLPKLSDGGMVFLFAPDAAWRAGDPWLARAG